MFVIENETHDQIGPVLHNLKSVHRPDGGWTTNAKVDEQLYDEHGDVYHIRMVHHVVEGTGPRVISHAAPAWNGTRWEKVKTVGPALPPPPDAQGTDPDAPGYDPDYADNWRNHRREAYEAAGATQDAKNEAMWDSAMQATPDHTKRDEIRAIRQAVRARFPKPVV